MLSTNVAAGRRRQKAKKTKKKEKIRGGGAVRITASSKQGSHDLYNGQGEPKSRNVGGERRLLRRPGRDRPKVKKRGRSWMERKVH